MHGGEGKNNRKKVPTHWAVKLQFHSCKLMVIVIFKTNIRPGKKRIENLISHMYGGVNMRDSCVALGVRSDCIRAVSMGDRQKIVVEFIAHGKYFILLLRFVGNYADYWQLKPIAD